MYIAIQSTYLYEMQRIETWGVPRSQHGKEHNTVNTYPIAKEMLEEMLNIKKMNLKATHI